MGVIITFKSGKTINFKTSTGYKQKEETFKSKAGKTYKAQGYVIFFGKGKKPIHYRVSQVSSISKS